MSKQHPAAPTASAVGPCPTVIHIAGRPGTGSLPSTVAPPDHPHEFEIAVVNVPSVFEPLKVYCSMIVLSCLPGSTYVRWGRMTCPGNGTETVYSGIV